MPGIGRDVAMSRPQSLPQLNGGNSKFALKAAFEAQEHFTRAERNAKPNFFRWKAKYSKAGDDYCKAAVLYRTGGELEECKTALLKACECFKKKRAWYSAGKTMEQVVNVAKTMNDYDGMLEFAWRAAALYRKSGQPDIAALLLEKAGKIFENLDTDKTMLMLDAAAETVETENRPVQAAIYVNKLLRLLLKQRKLSDATLRARKLVELYQEAEHSPSIGRSVLGLILLLLVDDNHHEAELTSREFGIYCDEKQHAAIEDLLDAYDQKNHDQMKNVVGSPPFQALDAEYSVVFQAILDKFEPIMEQKPQQVVKENTDNSSATKRTLANVVDRLKYIDEQSTEESSESSNLVPSSHERKRSLLQKMKMATIAEETPSRKPAAAIMVDFGTDDIERHRPGNLPHPAVYVDVEGIDPVQPAYMGMTVEQWRELKRSKSYDDAGGYEYEDDGEF